MKHKLELIHVSFESKLIIDGTPHPKVLKKLNTQ